MRPIARAVIALATMSALVACDDDTTGPTEFGRLRAVNAVTDVAQMDVLFNNSTYKTDLAFKGTDGYDEVSTGANVVMSAADSKREAWWRAESAAASFAMASRSANCGSP